MLSEEELKEIKNVVNEKTWEQVGVSIDFQRNCKAATIEELKHRKAQGLASGKKGEYLDLILDLKEVEKTFQIQERRHKQVVRRSRWALGVSIVAILLSIAQWIWG